MKRQYSFLIIFLASLVVFFACDNNRIFEKNRAIPEKGWNKDSVVSFEILITDTLQKHDLYINVRNDIKYKYSNLWLFIEINHPQNYMVTDTFEITLAEPSGKWLGEGFGGIKNQQIIYRKNLKLPVSGEYKINIMQGMREDVLTGITDIGIRLEKQE
ncbi:MAG: gliding motility lipoprotein GldH [Prolixibacteraceae bacterium]|nr:gliding motility lipoprotein GldH [Prolixibacteraceae bacterium]